MMSYFELHRYSEGWKQAYFLLDKYVLDLEASIKNIRRKYPIAHFEKYLQNQKS
jgi:hypothetical protein